MVKLLFKRSVAMKKFMLVVLLVFAAMAVLAACAPADNFNLNQVGDYARALPTWVIVVGAIVLLLIGFAIIWKLIPGFIKALALIALVVIIAGIAYGLWKIPYLDKGTIDKAGNAIENLLPQSSITPTDTANR